MKLSFKGKTGFTLHEAVVAAFLIAIVLGMVMQLFSSSSHTSEKVNHEQVIDLESQRLRSFLQADCRSAKTIQVRGKGLEIVRLGFDQKNNVQEAVVTYVFVNGNIVREENGGVKTFEFSKLQEEKQDFVCSFYLASPTTLCLKLFSRNSNKSILDERFIYETASK